jgi:pre-mRNA-processing factor SLU7
MSDYKNQKVLEEQRKEGRAPAEVDTKTGLEINPHIPSYIVNAPWYLDSGGATLEHQRPQEEAREAVKMDVWYKRGEKRGPAATSYRKGACKNCGAMSHKEKDCVERPRKKGAKFTGVDIMADEVVESISLNFEEKRDRWNGYNPDEQLGAIKEWEVIEEQRKIKRELEIKEKKLLGGEGDDGGEESEASESDDDKYADGVADPVQKKDMKAKDRVTVKNLRIREDTAKYLLNLDVDSSHYDPKTRSMRENPNADQELVCNLSGFNIVVERFDLYWRQFLSSYWRYL